MSTLYTAEQVHAEGLLPFKPRTLMQYAREDKIGCVRLGERKIRFRPEDIEAFIAAGAAPLVPKLAKPSRNPKYTR